MHTIGIAKKKSRQPIKYGAAKNNMSEQSIERFSGIVSFQFNRFVCRFTFNQSDPSADNEKIIILCS